MPGFDGTGPRGLGPMTGRGRGFCVLKSPDNPQEALTGLTGQANWLVSQRLGDDVQLAQLRSQARQIEGILQAINRRIEYLQTTRQRESLGV